MHIQSTSKVVAAVLFASNILVAAPKRLASQTSKSSQTNQSSTVKQGVKITEIPSDKLPSVAGNPVLDGLSAGKTYTISLINGIAVGHRFCATSMRLRDAVGGHYGPWTAITPPICNNCTAPCKKCAGNPAAIVTIGCLAPDVYLQIDFFDMLGPTHRRMSVHVAPRCVFPGETLCVIPKPADAKTQDHVGPNGYALGSCRSDIPSFSRRQGN